MENLSIDTINPWIPIILTIGSMIGNVLQFLSNRKKNKLLNDRERLGNIDLLNKGYNHLYDDLVMGIQARSKLFGYQVEYCLNNFVDFVKFLKDKEDKKK